MRYVTQNQSVGVQHLTDNDTHFSESIKDQYSNIKFTQQFQLFDTETHSRLLRGRKTFFVAFVKVFEFLSF